MRIALHLDDRVAQARLQALAAWMPQRLRTAASAALQEEARLLTPLLRAHLAQRLEVKRRSFLGAIKAKVIDRDPSRLPALWAGSRLPWLGVHERGAAIAGQMLIPLGRRIGRKRLKALVDGLLRQGNAYFVRSHSGRVVLMAENLAESDALLRGIKRDWRKRTGRKRLKRGQDVPIAVLVRRVSVRRRLDVHGVVAQRVPAIGARLLRTFKIA